MMTGASLVASRHVWASGKRRTNWANSGLPSHDSAFEWLEKAYKERAEGILYLKVEPKFDPLRDDPRFEDLLRRLGVPE